MDRLCYLLGLVVVQLAPVAFIASSASRGWQVVAIIGAGAAILTSGLLAITEIQESPERWAELQAWRRAEVAVSPMHPTGTRGPHATPSSMPPTHNPTTPNEFRVMYQGARAYMATTLVYVGFVSALAFAQARDPAAELSAGRSFALQVSVVLAGYSICRKGIWDAVAGGKGAFAALCFLTALVRGWASRLHVRT